MTLKGLLARKERAIEKFNEIKRKTIEIKFNSEDGIFVTILTIYLKLNKHSHPAN